MVQFCLLPLREFNSFCMMQKQKTPYIYALKFDWLTDLYDPIVRLTTREKRFKQQLIEQINVQAGHRVLDIGCGTATLAIALKRTCQAAEVFGLDGDHKILVLARKKAARAHAEVILKQGLSYNLPFADHTFDRVVSSLFFHHLTHESKQHTLLEIARVLKPGGELHVGDFGKPQHVAVRPGAFLLRLFDGFAVTEDNLKGRLPALFRQAGFEQVEQTGSLNTPFGTLVLYKAVKCNPGKSSATSS